jgi:dipeptidyl aminopeptidase/acylaminoacyl peptidase/hypoxanthine phosphoribosyltransferase
MSAELTAELLIRLCQPASPDISPDGQQIAWSAGPSGRTGEHPESAIFVAPVDGSTEPRQWTHGGNDRAPAWSPDGSRLAFLSDRAERGVLGLYVVDATGGEAAPLVVPGASISAFRWSPDGSTIAFVAPDKAADEKAPKIRGESWSPARLRTVDVAGHKVIDVVTDRHVVELAWSPDGGRIAYLAAPNPELDALKDCALWIGDVRIAAVGWASNLCWAGNRLVFLGPHDGLFVASETVWSVPADGGTPAVIGPQPSEPRCAESVVAVGAQALVRITEGLDTRLELRDPQTGAAEVVYASPGHVIAQAARQTPSGLVLGCVESTPERVFEVCAGIGAPRQISRHGADLADIRWGRVEDFGWTGRDGMALDGILVRPPDAPAGPVPLIVMPHGGPYGRSGRTLQATAGNWAQWLAAAGYAVLLPNYRGGSGRGMEFARLAAGGVGGDEFDDVLSGVDAAVAAGIADPDRLGIAGWSQGGFLSAWAVTQTDRFRAAVMGAGVSDWRSMVLQGDLPSFESELVEDLPWDGPGPHSADRHSPISYAKQVRTPTLILHGIDDVRVPYPQGDGFERALRDGPAPVRLVGYPGEPHGFTNAAHFRHVLTEVRAWFARWFAERPTPAPVQRRETLTWSDFGRAGQELGAQIAASGYKPDLILSIARGGLFLAGSLGYELDVKNLHVMNVAFYTGVDERLDMPVMLPPVPNAVDLTGAKVLVADDVADTGATLRLVRDFCERHVAEVRCAVIYQKPQSTVDCEYAWRRTDRWIDFPWST